MANGSSSFFLTLVLILSTVAVGTLSAVELDKDPDCFRTFMEIVQDKGYYIEEHEVTTTDGYVLGVFRIPFGQGQNSSSTPRQPVLLQHGLGDSSFSWILNMPNESLSYILADNGYDVWMGNNRGTRHSKKNLKYTQREKEFWDFSWDQFAAYDLPAMFSYIIDTTGYNKISYIGHSQGTIQMFAALTESSNMVRAHTNIFIGLGPVITVAHIESEAMIVLADKHVPDALYLMGIYQFPGPETACMENLLSSFCYLCAACCADVIEIICGPHQGAFNLSRMDVMGANEPGDTSTINMNHWAQAVRTGTFQKYDFGPVYNEKYYGSANPPAYNMSNLPSTVPIAIFSGEKDKLADPLDVQYLVSQIPGGPVFWKDIPQYAHLDFLWAIDAVTVMYGDILTLLAEYN